MSTAVTPLARDSTCERCLSVSPRTVFGYQPDSTTCSPRRLQQLAEPEQSPQDAVATATLTLCTSPSAAALTLVQANKLLTAASDLMQPPLLNEEQSVPPASTSSCSASIAPAMAAPGFSLPAHAYNPMRHVTAAWPHMIAPVGYPPAYLSPQQQQPGMERPHSMYPSSINPPWPMHMQPPPYACPINYAYHIPNLQQQQEQHAQRMQHAMGIFSHVPPLHMPHSGMLPFALFYF